MLLWHLQGCVDLMIIARTEYSKHPAMALFLPEQHLLERRQYKSGREHGAGKVCARVGTFVLFS